MLPTLTIAPQITDAPFTATPRPTATKAVTLTPALTKTPTPAQVQLTTAQWNRLIAADASLKHPAQPPTAVESYGPYVESKNVNGGYGYALTQDVRYGDISGDGAAEAIVPLASGGTAGVTGVLIYGAGATQPKLLTTLGGYKINAIADDGQLSATQPIYSPHDANCCPSGWVTERYRWNGTRLVQTSSADAGEPRARVQTVAAFYDLIKAHRYEEAYQLLSPNYQKRAPYATWVKGYNNTLSFEADVSEDAKGNPYVQITSVDQTTSGKVTRKYAGTWELIWGGLKSSGWLLDSANITESR
jgi:hypothetical protein